MPRLIWSVSALRDVQRPYRYLAEKNIDAAKRAVKILRNGVKVIAQPPGIGRPADEMEPEYREWMIDFAIAAMRHCPPRRTNGGDRPGTPSARNGLMTCWAA